MPRTHKSWDEIQESLTKHVADGDFAALEIAQVEEMMLIGCLTCPREKTLMQRAKFFGNVKFLDLKQILTLSEKGDPIGIESRNESEAS